MSTVFSITNDGLRPVHDLDSTCFIAMVDEHGDSIDGLGLKRPESHTDILSPSQKWSLPCDRVINMGYPVRTAEMTISITYRPDFVWWHRHIAFIVQAQRSDDGSWLWRRLPQ
jgi:hypothetical protein